MSYKIRTNAIPHGCYKDLYCILYTEMTASSGDLFNLQDLHIACIVIPEYLVSVVSCLYMLYA